MRAFLPTIILRHRKENLKKCSLRGLETRNDLIFYTYPKELPKNLNSYITLHLEGKELSYEDRDYNLFLMDSTWNYEQKMHATIKEKFPLIYRTLPKYFKTAYPRVQTGCLDEERGLATVEALYIALKIMKKDAKGILDHYYWKESFLKINEKAFALLE